MKCNLPVLFSGILYSNSFVFFINNSATSEPTTTWNVILIYNFTIWTIGLPMYVNINEWFRMTALNQIILLLYSKLPRQRYHKKIKKLDNYVQEKIELWYKVCRIS